MDSERIKLLQATPVFGAITERTLAFLLEKCSDRTLAEGDYFFRENDEAASMYILEAGIVSVIRHWMDKPVVLRQLKSGDCFGEIALMEMMPRSASVRADSTCKAVELPRSALFELYQADLEQFTLIQMNLGREICRRLHYADDCLFAARHGP